jgi:hypothetical protein
MENYESKIDDLVIEWRVLIHIRWRLKNNEHFISPAGRQL